MSEKPQLRSYLNVHHYLADLYKYRKANEAGFSYETWSQELNINNRSFLRQIVIGRRTLTEKVTQIFCDRLNLQGVDREFFELLVSYSNCKNQKQRNLFGQKLMLLMKQDFQQTEIQNYYELVSTPLYPKILTLLTFRDIPKDSNSLAMLLGVPVDDVRKGLEKLYSLGLIELNEETQQWKATERQVKVPDVVGDGALLDYHSESLKEAIAARNLSKDQRRYKAVLLPLNPQEFSEFLADMQVFVKDTLKKYDTDDLRSRRLHQVNFNIYTVSEEPGVLSGAEVSP